MVRFLIAWRSGTSHPGWASLGRVNCFSFAYGNVTPDFGTRKKLSKPPDNFISCPEILNMPRNPFRVPNAFDIAKTVGQGFYRQKTSFPWTWESNGRFKWGTFLDSKKTIIVFFWRRRSPCVMSVGFPRARGREAWGKKKNGRCFEVHRPGASFTSHLVDHQVFPGTSVPTRQM